MTEPGRTVRGETVLDKASLALFTIGTFCGGFATAMVFINDASPLLVLPSIGAAWLGGKNLLTRRVPSWGELS